MILQRGQRLFVFLLVANAGIELAHRALEILGLRQRAIDGVALPFKRGSPLHHRITQRLERAHFALHGIDRLLHAVHAPHCGFDTLDAPLLVLQPTAQVVATAVQRFHLRHRQLMRVDQAVVLLTQPHQLFGGVLDLVAQRLGIALDLLERLVDVEEGAEAVLQVERLVDLAADFIERRADLLGILDGTCDLRLGQLLPLRELGGARLESLELAGHVRQRTEPLLETIQARCHSVDVTTGLGDRLAQLGQARGSGLDTLQQRLVAAALLLHLLQDVAHLFGEFGVA